MMSTTETSVKQCRICRRTLPITAFGKYRRNRGGYKYECKDCCSRMEKERSVKNAEALFLQMPKKFCECKCGGILKNPYARSIRGHQNRGKRHPMLGKHHSKQTIEKIRCWVCDKEVKSRDTVLGCCLSCYSFFYSDSKNMYTFGVPYTPIICQICKKQFQSKAGRERCCQECKDEMADEKVKCNFPGCERLMPKYYRISDGIVINKIRKLCDKHKYVSDSRVCERCGSNETFRNKHGYTILILNSNDECCGLIGLGFE